MAISGQTPGMGEPGGFAPSIVGVATAVPIFVGYTETAKDPSGRAAYDRAMPVASMADYAAYFGGAPPVNGIVELQPAAAAGTADFDAESSNGNGVTTGAYAVYPTPDRIGGLAGSGRFNLHAAMGLFFANGGGNCFVISVGNYWGSEAVAASGDGPLCKVSREDLLQGLAVARDTSGGTMLVVPDACLLAVPPSDGGPYTYPHYQPVAVEMLRQSATLGDRVAILDLPGALVPDNWSPAAMKAEAEAFYEAIAPGQAGFSYGTAYGPALQSSLLSAADILYTGLRGTGASTTLMNNLLTTRALALHPPTSDPGSPGVRIHQAAFVEIAAHIAAAFPVSGAAAIPSVPADVTGTTSAPVLEVSMPGAVAVPAATDGAAIQALDAFLVSAVPLLTEIETALAARLNVVPASGAIAGVWTFNDSTGGVWNAPANITLNEVLEPMVALTDDQQGDYNVPLNGNAIDILRSMLNRGTVVWGARTLDGNSNDYRYIQVRRTLVYIQQSIKLALQPFTFAPNDGGTWTTVTAMVSGFLTQVWQAGGLMGDKASEAFTVQCGVPTTMSGEDVLNGYMIVNVTLAMLHPAEFIELTFKQVIQGA
jgi:hypothetical protein